MYKLLDFMGINIYKDLGKNVYILFIAKLINSLGYFVIPFLSLYLTDALEIELIIVGIIVSCVNITSIPMTWIGSKLTLYFSKKLILIMSNLLSAVSYIMVAVCPGKITSVIFIILGFGLSSIAVPAFDGYTGQVCKENRKKQSFSLMYLGQNIGVAVGALIVGALYNLSHDAIFIVDALSTIASVILMIFLLDNDKNINEINTDSNEISVYNNVDNSKVDKPSIIINYRNMFYIVIVLYSLAYAQLFFVLPLYINYMDEIYGAQIYGILITINAIGVVVLTPMITRVLNKFKASKSLIIAGILYSVGYCSYTFCNNLILLCIPTIIWTIGEIVYSTNYLIYLIEGSPTWEISKISSRATISNRLGTIASSLMGSTLLVIVSFENIWLVIPLITLSGVLLMYISQKLNKKEQQ